MFNVNTRLNVGKDDINADVPVLLNFGFASFEI